MQLALVLLLALLTLSASDAFAVEHCTQYSKKPNWIEAIQIVATRMQYTMDELCNLERIADIYVTDTVQYTPKGEPIPLDWVTLHYNEYSCQYFIRKDTREMYKKNCYNTF